MVIGIDCSRAFTHERTGTENYSYHVVTQMLALPEAKRHHFVLFTRPNAVIPESVKQLNVTIKPIKLRYLWTQVGLAGETWRKPPIDVLWVPAHTLPVLRNPRVKTVVTIHGLEYRWLPEYRNLLQRWYLPLSTIYAAHRADGLIAVSQFTKQQLINELHTTSNKIKVVQEGVAASARRHSDTVPLQKYGLQEKHYALFVGTVQPRKNLVSLIEAFAGYQRDFPEEKLVIAGSIGWSAEGVLQAPQRLGIQESVVFTGRVSQTELDSLYRGARMYVQPSITEGFGLPVLEAMRHSVPVIVSDGGALSEVAGGAAVVVPLRTQFVSRLSHAMAKITRDPNFVRQLIVKGQKRVATLTWQKTAEATLKWLTNSHLYKI